MRARTHLPPIFASLLLASLAVACTGGSEATTEPEVVVPMRVVRGDLDRRILLTGELLAEDAVGLIAPNVEQWPLQVRWIAEEGLEVKAGDPVVEFDNSQLASRQQELQARLIEEGHNLASLEARLASDLAQAEFELLKGQADVEKAKIKARIPKELVVEREYNNHQLALHRAKLELEKAQRKLEAQRQAGQAELAIQKLTFARAVEELQQAESRLEALVLRAPRDGIVILGQHRRERRQLLNGDSIFPGEVAARLPNLQTLMVEARLFDVDDGAIQTGMAIEGILDAFPERVFMGRIRAIDQIAQQAENRSLRRHFRVLIDLDETDIERMRPGMSVKIVVDDARHRDVLLLPRQSLRWRTTEPSLSGPQARLADGSWADVELGACNTMFCILENGLSEGTALATVSLTSERFSASS